MRHLVAGVLPVNAITSLLEQAKIQAEQELDFQQAKAAHEVLQKRDKKLLAHLSKMALTSTQIADIKIFLDQENQALNTKLDGGGIPWLNVDSEDLKKLEHLLQHQLSPQIQVADKQLEKLQQLETQTDLTERELAVAASPEEYQKLDDALKEAQKELIACQTA